MTTLKNRLRQDATAALKSGDKITLSTLRGVLGEIETREKAGKAPVDLNDQQVEALLRKEVAKRRETAGIYSGAGQPERAAKENAEAQVVEDYLPKMLTEAEVSEIIDQVITGPRITSAGTLHFSAVMRGAQRRIAGRYDGKAVAELVRVRLGS